MKLKATLFSAIIACGPFSIKADAQYNTAGDNVFGSSAIHTVNIYSPDPNFWDSLVANYTLDRKIYCSLMLDSVQLMDSVGIQLKGNSSYNSMPGVKKSMKLQFNYWVAGQGWDGLKEIVLNNGFKDPTMLREKIYLDFLNRHFVYSPRATYAKVYINGTYWGLYTMVESASAKKFLDRNFNDKRGNLFKGDPQGTLQWVGSTPSLYYPKYELKTNEIQNNWSDLVQLINRINNMPPSDFYDSLETVLDSYSFINCWAANVIFANLDSYQGSGHNYYIYHDSLINKFRWITWDVNEAFGNFQMTMNTSQIENMSIFYVGGPPGSRPLEQKMIADPTYKQNYIWTICAMAQAFTNANLDPVIDSLANRIRSAVYADLNKQFTNQQFEDNQVTDVGNIPGLKSFITARRNALMSELANYGCYLSTGEQTANAEMQVYPNPAGSQVYIALPSALQKIEVKVTDMLGRTVLSLSAAGSDYVTLDVSSLHEGIYSVNINNSLFSKLEIIH